MTFSCMIRSGDISKQNDQTTGPQIQRESLLMTRITSNDSHKHPNMYENQLLSLNHVAV